MQTSKAAALTSEQAANWCAERGILSSGVESPASVRPFRFSLEQSPGQLIALTDRVLPVGWPDEADTACLIWVQERDIWADYNEEVGFHIWSKLVSEQADAALFSASNGRAAQAAMLCPILFGWDALVVPEGAGWFLRLQHEGTAIVCAEDPDRRAQVLERLTLTSVDQADVS